MINNYNRLKSEQVSKSVSYKDALKIFDDFKNKQKNVWSIAIWYVKVYIFWESLQYCMHRDKIHTLQKNTRAK